MAASNSVQSSFLGGEWSPFAQGRIDLPEYRRAMKTCKNAIILQEGAWTRRGGFFRMGPTVHGEAGFVRPFILPNNAPGYLEFTFNGSTSNLRFWQANATGTGFILLSGSNATILAISTATPAVMQIGTAETWSTGDQVFIQFDQASAIGPAAGLGAPRLLTLTRIDSTHYSLTDGVTGSSINGAALNYVNSAADSVFHITQIPLPYTSLADLQAVRVVKADSLALLLHKNYTPQALYWGGAGFTLTSGAGIQAWDGPYLDPFLGSAESQQGVSSGVVGSWTGSSTSTFTLSDGSYTFTSADVGKLLRLFSQPPAWDQTLDYGTLTPPGAGNRYVTFGGSFWFYQDSSFDTSHQSQGVPPGQSYIVNDSGKTYTVVPWQPAPYAGNWNYAVITAVNSGTQVAITYLLSVVSYPGNYYLTADIWQLGLYGPGSYPACGSYHEGRLFLGGTTPNRDDASVADSLDMQKVATAGGIVPANAFSPTDRLGNVGDANAIAMVSNDDEINTTQWFAPNAIGVTAGTAGGEFLINASALNDPLAPTTVQVHKNTKFKSSLAEPLRIGAVILFVQLFGRRVMEYFADAFTRALTARHLNEYSGHLAQAGIAEIKYQEERTPIVWARRNDNALVGCTYRRVSQFAAEPPLFTAWHEHSHGFGNAIESICTGPNPAGTIDCLVAMTKDPITGYRDLQFMASVFEEGFLLPAAMHIDGAMLPSGTDAGTSTITFYGLADYAGKTVTAWIAGLDCGDHVVSATGSITIPYGSDPDGLLTEAYLQGVSNTGGWLYTAPIDVTIGGVLTRVNVPCAVGATFTSQGRRLPSLAQEDSRTTTGPALGMTKREHAYTLLVVNTIGASAVATAGLTIGGSFDHQQPVIFQVSPEDQTRLSTVQMKTGWHEDVLDATYTIEGGIAWQMTRPYPATIAAVSGFGKTEERQ